MADNKPQGTAVAPQGTAVAPQGTSVAPQGTAVAPQGTAVAPQGTAVAPQGTAAAPQGTAASSKTAGTASSGHSYTLQPGDVITIDGKDYKVVRGFNSGSEAELYEVTCNRKSYGLKLYRKGFKPNGKIGPILGKIQDQGYTAAIHSAGKTTLRNVIYDYELMDWYPLGSANAAGLKGNSDAILAITVKTALALDVFHKAGFVHKDIKPANILIKDKTTWDSVICDFGIADILKDGKAATRQLRTPIYAAPEIYDPKKAISIVDGENLFEITGKADYYALGMTILSLWYGESEFLVKETDMSIKKLTTGIVVPADMPDPLATIARGLLLKNPLKRWDLDEIQNFLAGGNFSVKEDEILEDLGIVYNAGKNQTANTVEELARFMVEDLDLAKRYLYKGKLKAWLKARPEIQDELEDIVEKRYPKDMDLGVWAAIYVLDPEYGFLLSGWNRQTGEEVYLSARDSGEVIKFCTENYCDFETKEKIVSDLFTDWLSLEFFEELWRIEELTPRYTRDEDERQKEIDIVFRLRIQTMDPLCDICLCNNVNDPLYAMTGASIARMMNVAYQTLHVDFIDDPESLVDEWKTQKYAPYNTHMDELLLFYIIETDDYETSYLHRFFQTKGKRFKDQDATLKSEINRRFHPGRNQLRPDDSAIIEGATIMRLISAFGHKPTYRFFGTDIEVSDLSQFRRYLGKKKMVEDAFYEHSLGGWLTVQYHEDPHADFSAQYSYEQKLLEYTKCLGAIDPENSYFVNYQTAAQEARELASECGGRVKKTYMRDMGQKALAVIFGVIPLLYLTIRIIGSLIQDPTLSSDIEFSSIFYSIGLIVAVIVFFTGEMDSCLAALIIGGIVSGIVWLVLAFLTPFLLWIFLALVIFVIIYFSRKTLFNVSGYAQDAKDVTDPGFEELELEPLHYAYTDVEEFDSSLNGTMDDGDVEDWLDDIKARRRPLILFIISTIVLLVLGGFLP